MNGFNVSNYWNNRYIAGGLSGAGSYGVEALTKANIINHWIKELNLRTITELGCGDGNNLLMYKIPTSYCGYDVSHKAIEICNEKTKRIHNGLKYYFTDKLENIDTDADLCLSLDVWYHLVDDKVFDDYCDLLFNNNWKYIIAYTTDTNEQTLSDGTPLAEHLRFREFLNKVSEYPKWKPEQILTGFQSTDGKVFGFPNGKRFYLLKNLEKS